MLELIVVGLVIAVARYGVADVVASWRGQPTARALDKAARTEAAAKAAHDRRQAHLGPTIGQALASRIADWIVSPERRARREAKRQRRTEKPPPAAWLVLNNWWRDVAEEADYRREQKRMDRLNRRREREGQDPIDVDAEVLDMVECLGQCGVLVAASDFEYCDACIAQMPVMTAAEAQALPTYPCRNNCGGEVHDPGDTCPGCIRATRDARQRSTPQSEPSGTVIVWCSVCFAKTNAVDTAGRCPACVRGNFGHAHYCTAGCGTPVGKAGQRCPACATKADAAARQDADDETPEPAPAPDTAGKEDPSMATAEQAAQQRHDETQLALADHEAGRGVASAEAAAEARARGDNARADHLEEKSAAHEAAAERLYAEAVQPATGQTPHGTTEGTTPMSQPGTVIDGDVHDPTGARARAQSCVSTAEQIIGVLDQAASCLEGMGVGAEAVGEVRGLADDIAPYIAAGTDAVAVYDRHAATATDISSNPDLAGTTAGTYLDGARA